MFKQKTTDFLGVSVIKASAGSGKTHALTKRFVGFLMDGRVSNNRLENIMAVTFTNQAANEMKEKVLRWLKEASLHCLDSEEKTAGRVSELLDLLPYTCKKELGQKASILIDEILANYGDLQVGTIDSFISRLLKVFAIELGVSSGFGILVKKDEIMKYAFELFLRGVREGTKEATLLKEMIQIICESKSHDSKYPWEPSGMIFQVMKGIHEKLALYLKPLEMRDYADEMMGLKRDIEEKVNQLNTIIKSYQFKRHGHSSFNKISKAIKSHCYHTLTNVEGFSNLPVIQDRKKDPYKQDGINKIKAEWAIIVGLINRYKAVYARSFYYPYAKMYEAVICLLEGVKKRRGVFFIEDLNRKLTCYLKDESVEDLCFRLGRQVYHYMIDEFQDTSPMQWANLLPLLKHFLNKNGSLFIVGDTKQAIYGFRGADYKIMKGLESNGAVFGVKPHVECLDTNFRSFQKILNFNQKFFFENVGNSDNYKEAASLSGINAFEQKVVRGNKNKGHVEVHVCHKKDDKEEEPKERRIIVDLVKDLHKRHYEYGDVAILARDNKSVVDVSSWLNEGKYPIPFISYSNLDVRKNKIATELFNLLKFLDSPLDDLAFATFILGDIFQEVSGIDSNGNEMRKFLFRNKKLRHLKEDSNKKPHLLYKVFQEEFQDLWCRYFKNLFKSIGYFPLYDLTNEVYRTFDILNRFRNQEATLVKILEVVKDFEALGSNNIKDFLSHFTDDKTDPDLWNIQTPQSMDAVKIMTIHKAKGLEFPAVIILYKEKSKAQNYNYFVEEKKERLSLLKITKTIKGVEEKLKNLHEEKRIGSIVDELNTLYVAFTRAKSEMHIVGVKKAEKNTKGENGTLIDLLPLEDFGDTEPAKRPVNPMKIRIEGEQDKNIISLSYGYSLYAPVLLKKEDGLYRLEGAKRGEFIHKILSLIEYIDDNLDKLLLDAIKQASMGTGGIYLEDEIKRTIMDFIQYEPMRAYFVMKEGRQVKNEQEFSDGHGNLYRMDRVVMDKDCITVIDFKAGQGEKEEERFQAQLGLYMHILSTIYPKKVEGFLAYVDLKKIRRV